VIVARSILTHIKHEDITDVIVGNVLQAGQGMNPERQIVLKSGLAFHVSGQTIKRVCGSGMQAVISAIQALKAGDGRVYLSGGIENMSRAPFIINDIRLPS
jgi:acetyl-CoA C-acetyltransferase